jgi:hypothetical protein
MWMDWKKENMDASTRYPHRELEEKKRGCKNLLFMTSYKMPRIVKESLSFTTWSSAQLATNLH